MLDKSGSNENLRQVVFCVKVLKCINPKNMHWYKTLADGKIRLINNPSQATFFAQESTQPVSLKSNNTLHPGLNQLPASHSQLLNPLPFLNSRAL